MDSKQIMAFREWYNAQWLGDQEHGQYIPHNGDPKYTEYMDGHQLGLGAWMACLQHNSMESNGEVRGASRLAGEASSAEGATSTVVLGAERPGKD